MEFKTICLDEKINYVVNCSKINKQISLQVIENDNEIKIQYGDKSLNLFETLEKQENEQDVSDLELQITI